MVKKGLHKMKIKKCLTLSAILVTLLSTTAGYGKPAEISQNFTEPISAVNLKCNAYLHIKIGSEDKLTVKTDDSIIKNVSTSVKNGTLNLMSKGQKKLWWDVVGIFSTKKRIDFYLTVKELNKLTISSIGKIFINSDIKGDNFNITNLGTADIKMNDISVNDFQLNILGGGNIKIASLYAANQIEINTSGTGHIYFDKIKTSSLDFSITGNTSILIKESLEANQLHALILGSGAFGVHHGKVDSQNIKVDGSGRYNCEPLISNNVIIKSFGSTSIEVFVQNSATVDIYGSGIVNITGQPKIKECSIYGKGNLILQEGSQEAI